ncbi:MAG: four-carbon acid sugar kinase family protein [Christensenellales bacterium]
MTLSTDVLASYPPYDLAQVHRAWRAQVEGFPFKVVVLDDDPTGVQTVHGVYVYTGWSEEALEEAFRVPGSLFFILTNSRGLDARGTEALHQEIARNLMTVSKRTGQDFILISRSDSTLRGHYPLETETLRRTLEEEGHPPLDGEILMPFFQQGGRYTLGDTHYVASGDRLVPCGETEFARDKTFGYASSHLPEWIEEKTKGEYPASSVSSITLEELRAGDQAAIGRKLEGLHHFGKLIVNAVQDADVEVFVTALVPHLCSGKRFLFRSAAALPRALGGVEPRDLLSREELQDQGSRNGGLIVVGSHVEKTSRQLEALRKDSSLLFLELNQHCAMEPAAFSHECKRVQERMNKAVAFGQTTVLYTNRQRFDLNTGNREDELRLAGVISDAITGLVLGLEKRPAFIVAKGGITSSEIGTKGLQVRRALVLGQILPGIPVWRLGEESRYPGMKYVIFPGNVGDDQALYDVVQKMKRTRTQEGSETGI